MEVLELKEQIWTSFDRHKNMSAKIIFFFDFEKIVKISENWGIFEKLSGLKLQMQKIYENLLKMQ